MAKEKTATLIRDELPDFRGHAALYRVEPPIEGYEPWDETKQAPKYSYVVVSAVSVLGTPETYMFGANEHGEIVDWGELPGSQKGTLSHTQVLTEAGYYLVRAA